jgi:hypothetical protein
MIMKGCELDTDGDGNCPIHPNGCPAIQGCCPQCNANFENYGTKMAML